MRNRQLLFLIVLAIAVAGFVIWYFQRTNSSVSTIAPATVRSENAESARPLHTKDVDTNESFEFPFLGVIRASSKVEKVQCGLENEGGGTIDVKVFSNEEGTFLRAEYLRPGSKNQEWSASNAEKNYKPVEQRIVGVPTAPARVTLQKIIDNVRKVSDGKLEKASQFSITRVILAAPQLGEPQEVFIVNTFGIAKISDKMPDGEEFKRIRLVLDADGEILFIDNVI